MEKGYRYYGTDMGLLDNPYEAGLGFAVDREKWSRIDRNVTRRLRTLAVGGQKYVPVYGGEAVLHEGRVLGRLRSCAYGFTVAMNLAYSYLPAELKPDASVAVEVFGELVPATVMRDRVLEPQPAR
jgi:dimethylglycine oxidase